MNNMKILLLAMIGVIPIPTESNYVYVGSFESSEIQSRTHWETPKDIYEELITDSYRNDDKVILSTGISNQCSDRTYIKKQIKFLSENVEELIVIKDEVCIGGESLLRLECKKYSNCTMMSFHELEYIK